MEEESCECPADIGELTDPLPLTGKEATVETSEAVPAVNTVR